MGVPQIADLLSSFFMKRIAIFRIFESSKSQLVQFKILLVSNRIFGTVATDRWCLSFDALFVSSAADDQLLRPAHQSDLPCEKRQELKEQIAINAINVKKIIRFIFLTIFLSLYYVISYKNSFVEPLILSARLTWRFRRLPRRRLMPKQWAGRWRKV